MTNNNTGKNNGFPFWDILGYLKNTHKNAKFGKVRQVPTREFPTKFPDWDPRNLLCLVSSIMVNKALQLDVEVEGMLLTGRRTIHFPNPLGMRYLDGKHSGSQQIASFQTTFY